MRVFASILCFALLLSVGCDAPAQKSAEVSSGVSTEHGGAATASPATSPQQLEDLHRIAGAGGETVDSAAVHRGPLLFTEITQTAGIDFVHYSGDNDERPFPAANGSGVAALDIDLDGRTDLLFLNGASFPADDHRQLPGDQLYRNRPGLQFAKVSLAAGIAPATIRLPVASRSRCAAPGCGNLPRPAAFRQ